MSAPDPPDAVLVRRVADGAEAALQALVERHSAWLSLRLRRRVGDPDIVAGRFDTTWLEDRLGTLAPVPASPTGLAGAKVDTSDPLAVLVHGKQGGAAAVRVVRADGLVPVTSPLQGTVVRGEVAEGGTHGVSMAVLPTVRRCSVEVQQGVWGRSSGS